MNDIDIWERFFATLGENRDYMETANLIQRLEPDFLAALEALSSAQRAQVEQYISACDIQSDSMIHHAYRLGYEAGRQRHFLSNPK